MESTTDLILTYMSFHIYRAAKNLISRTTVRNFYKPINLFCDMNNILFNFKLITKGIPSGTKNSNDRIPTKDEILKLLSYPDRRIKPITYTMISSGIRVGAREYLKWKHIVPIRRQGLAIQSNSFFRNLQRKDDEIARLWGVERQSKIQVSKMNKLIQALSSDQKKPIKRRK